MSTCLLLLRCWLNESTLSKFLPAAVVRRYGRKLIEAHERVEHLQLQSRDWIVLSVRLRVLVSRRCVMWPEMAESLGNGAGIIGAEKM